MIYRSKEISRIDSVKYWGLSLPGSLVAFAFASLVVAVLVFVYTGRLAGASIVAGLDIAIRTKMQSIFMDWVRNKEGGYSLLEISYATPDDLIYDVTGFWDRDLKWHPGHTFPSIAVIEDMISEVNT